MENSKMRRCSPDFQSVGTKSMDSISEVRNRKSKLQFGEDGVYFPGWRIVVAGTGRTK